jgi:hypothetical protein
MVSGDGSDPSGSRISVIDALDDADIVRFYSLYHDAFDPLRTKAAGRHLLTESEFAAEMVDRRIDKYVAWKGGAAVGLTTVATDLAAVPWLESAFFLARYGPEAERRALFYLGFTLVDPHLATYRVFKGMMDTVCQRFAAAQGVCGFDFCDYNARGAVGRVVRALPETFGATVSLIDVQSYSVVDFSGVTPPDDGPVPQEVDAQYFFIADFRPVADRGENRVPPAPQVPSQRQQAVDEPANGHETSARTGWRVPGTR